MATSTFSTHPDKPGWGCFKYDSQLVLTKDGEENKSYWELPPCFRNEKGNFTHSLKSWKVMSNECVEMQTYGRGDQEMYISSNPKVVDWAENLITSCSLYE